LTQELDGSLDPGLAMGTVEGNKIAHPASSFGRDRERGAMAQSDLRLMVGEKNQHPKPAPFIDERFRSWLSSGSLLPVGDNPRF
jgi:hypothetical protein